MKLARILVACAVATPALAAPRAVVLGVWGNVPGTPLDEMTDAWREAAAKVKGFEWIAFKKSLTALRAEPGCATLGPACRVRVAKEIGAEVMFFAKHANWGGAFEQIDVATGTTTRKARIAFEGEDLTAKLRDAGLAFVTGGAGEAPATVAVATVPSSTATPPAPTPATPAIPATPATPAIPATSAGKPTAAVPATPATPATPARPTTTATPPAASAAAAPRKAAVLGIVGGEPGAPLQEMTDAWREAAAHVAGYRWIPLSRTIADMQAAPDCTKFSPACRQRIAEEIGADVLFVAKSMPWGGAFEQIDVASGTTTRKARIGFEGKRAALIAGCRDAGVKFVTDGAPAQPAGAVPVAVVPAPAAPSTHAATPPASTPAPPAEAPRPEVAKLEPAEPPAAPAPVTQVIDPEISRKPAPAPAADVRAEATPSGPSVWSRVRLRTWLAAGGTAALLGTGVVFGLRSKSAEDDLNDPSRGCETTEQLAVCRDLEDKARARALIANILFAAGGAAAVGTGWLFYLDLREDHAGAQVAVRF